MCKKIKYLFVTDKVIFYFYNRINKIKLYKNG